MTSLIHFEYHRPGKAVTVYREWLLATAGDARVLLLDDYDGDDVDAGGRRILDAGAPIVWYVFPDAWYDVGRFHLADGTFTGWYTNLSAPVQMGDKRWVGHDLFLDLWQPLEGGHQWLDEDEFEAAVAAGLVDTQTSRRVLKERKAIQERIDSGAWPPAVVNEVDLEQARSLKNA